MQNVISRLAFSATSSAQWLLADFAVPSTGLRRLRAEAIHRLMYFFFRTATGISARRLTPPDAFLRAHDFDLRCRTTSNLGLLHSDLWSR
jgi:hypothetical protein